MEETAGGAIGDREGEGSLGDVGLGLEPSGAVGRCTVFAPAVMAQEDGSGVHLPLLYRWAVGTKGAPGKGS